MRLRKARTDSENAADIIKGLFQINAKLGDIIEHLAAIRALLEEDDGRGDAEEG